MRLQRHVPMLAAAAAAAAALAAPSAQAMPNHNTGIAGSSLSAVAHHPDDATDMALIGAGAGSITLLAAGIAVQRRTSRKRPVTPRASTSLGN